MAVKLQRPILVGGIGLSLLLWLLDSVQHSVAELGGTTMSVSYTHLTLPTIHSVELSVGAVSL